MFQNLGKSTGFSTYTFLFDHKLEKVSQRDILNQIFLLLMPDNEENIWASLTMSLFHSLEWEGTGYLSKCEVPSVTFHR